MSQDVLTRTPSPEGQAHITPYPTTENPQHSAPARRGPWAGLWVLWGPCYVLTLSPASTEGGPAWCRVFS